jgi:hypothetical protein
MTQMAIAPMSIDRFVRCVASHGLDGADRIFDLIGDEEWTGALNRLSSQSLCGLAVAAAEDGAIALTKDQWSQLLERHRGAMCAALLLERKLLRLTQALEDAGIPTIVLKGASFAHTVYPDPSWRAFADLDLLVPTSDFKRASAVLVGLGHERRLPEPRPGFDERFGKAAVHKSGDHVEVDLHRTLVLGPYSIWVDPRPLFDHHATFELGGQTLRCLSAEHRFIHACMHAVLGDNPPRIKAIRDAVQTARTELDMVMIEREVAAWKLEAVMDAAARLVRERLGVEPHPVLASFAGRPATALQRKVLHAYTGPARWSGSTATSMLRVIPGLRAKLFYLRAMVVPSGAFVARRSGSDRGRLSAYRHRWRMARLAAGRRLRARRARGARA